MWRDLLCLALVILSRCLGGANRWAGFLKCGRISGPNSSILPEVDTMRIYVTVIDLFAYILKTQLTGEKKDVQFTLDITIASILCLSVAILSSGSVQSTLLESPEALAILTSTSSVLASMNITSIEINLCVCHLMTYLSLVAPLGSSPKRILSDAAGLSIVALLNHITSNPPESSFPQLLSDFDFSYSLAVKRHAAHSNDVNDAILKILCGEDGERTSSVTGIESLGDVGKVALGLLVGFCDPRVWILGENEEEDGEIIVSDSEVMSRIRGVTRALFAQSNNAPMFARVALIEFLGMVFELGNIGSSEEETNALSLKRSVCLSVMDQVDGWNHLFGPNYYANPTDNYKQLVLSFVVDVAILPDTSNVGLLLTLLQIISDSDTASLKVTAVRTISAICQFSKSAMERSIESLIKLNFVQHMVPIIATTTIDEVHAFDLSKTMLFLINHLCRSNFNCALYVAEHNQTRALLLSCLKRTGKIPTEISILGSTVVMSIMSTLLSATDKRIATTTCHSGSEANHIIQTWISSYMCCFEQSIESISGLNIHLRLLKGLRSVMKFFPSGSLERGRIRSRLIEAKILERLVGLFGVTFVEKEGSPTSTASPAAPPTLVGDSPTAESPSLTSPCASTLSVTVSEAMLRVHSHALIATMGSILTGSVFANRCFKAMSGFDEMKHRIFSNGQRRIWPGFLNDMIGLLVPKTMRPVPEEFAATKWIENEVVWDSALEISNVLVIRNLSVLEPIFLLFESCDNDLRMLLLDYLEKLALGHEMNRVLMTQGGAVGMLLKNVLSKVEGLEQLEKFIKLFEVVANYSISVAEAKYLFRCLRHFEASRADFFEYPTLTRSRSLSHMSMQTPLRSLSRRPSGSLFDIRSTTTCLPFYYDALLRTVLKLFQRNDPDLDMFYFSGRNSGLILPQLEKWPSSSGYSYIGWIKMQDYTTAPQDSNDIMNFPRMILSIRADNGDGVELFIFKSILNLTVFRGGQTYSLTVPELPLISKRWYFIAVCHASPKLPWYANPDATIYINGVARATGKLPYPDTRPHHFNRIGASGYVPSTLETPSKRRFETHAVSNDSIPDIGDVFTQDSVSCCFSSFSGQMTSVYLMDDTLTQPQVEALNEIGQGHCSQFKSEDLASFPDVGKILFDGSLHSKILLQLYPTATRHGNVSSVCCDIGPRHLGDVEMRDVISCSSKCLQTAVHAFGGIEVTFPLISHLNYSIQPIPVGGMSKTAAASPLETPPAMRNNRLSIFLQMIALLLANDIAHMERFAVVQGPRILAMLLQQQDAKLLNMKSLDGIMAVVKIASDITVTSPKIAPPGSVLSLLSEEIEDSLVFEYRLWSLTDVTVQFQHVEFLNHFLLANNQTHRAKYGLGFLVDVLEKFYWTVPPDFLSPDLLAKLMLSRPDAASITKLRQSIFGIMTDLVTKGGGIRPDECHRLALTLWTCRHDPTHVLELLGFIIDCCLGFSSNAVLESFLAHGTCMELLMSLAFHSDSEAIRISTMKLIFLLLKSSRTPEKYKKKLKLEEFPGNLTSATPTLYHCGSVVARNLAAHPMSRHLYLSMLQLAVEEQLLDWHTDKLVVQLTDLPNVSIVNSAYLVAVLELLSKRNFTSPSEADAVITTALEDLLFIITRSPVNSELFRKIYGWQILLVDLLPFDNPAATNLSDDSAASVTPRKEHALESICLSPVAESPMPGNGEPAAIVLEQLLPAATSVVYEQILNRVAEIFSICVLDSFVSDRRVWKLVEETLVLVWSSKKVDGLSSGMKIIGALLKGMMRKLRLDIQGGDADMFTGSTLENTFHLISLVEEFLFSYHDVYNEILNEANNVEPTNSTENLVEPVSFIDNIVHKLNLKSKTKPASGVQVAYPFHDNRNVAEECVDLIGSLLEFGITHVSLSDAADKSHARAGGIPRIQLRLLLNAISTGSHEVWSTVLPHFMSLFEKYAHSLSENQSKNEMAHVLAQLTDAYKLSLTTVEHNQTVAHPASSAIFPLFILVLQQWQESISQMWKSKDGSIFTAELLVQAESNVDSFNSLINSTAWTLLYDEHFFPGSRLAEEEEISLIPNIKKRYSKVSRPIIQKSVKEAAFVARLIVNLESHLKILHTRRESEAHVRLPEALAAQETDKRLVARRWLAMFHELTQERGIWLPKKVEAGDENFSKLPSGGAGGATGGSGGGGGGGGGLKWKLDRTENSMRMHARLIPNFEFDNHKEASMRRDRCHVSKESLVAATEPELVNDESLSHLTSTERKKAKVEKLKSHYQSGASNDELREVSNSMGALNVTEEDLVEEDWDLITNEEMSINVDSETFLFSCECEMILLMTAVKGKLELSSSSITFFADLRATATNLSEADQKTLVLLAESEVLLRERRWSISKLREAYFRRYKLRNSAVEFFFVDGANCFFTFKTAKQKMKLMTSIIRLKPKNLKVADIRNPAEMIAKSDVTDRWQRHEISNFEYLMQLNTISGRTNNDLTQYPVFPWVLTDYKSEKLDLSDKSVYRDLSKPIGALDPTRLEQFLQRYESFEDPSGQIKKFMYGTHYSTSAAVLFYMLRMEPFTSLHIALQGGKFDHPDRQFDSIENCWKSVLSGNGDVKELIPEFFYMPEFLVNENEFDLGTKQTGVPLNNVVLPPWASSPEEFIRIHREALEGDYVSEHLHEWIDLIWGYKQTGQEAVAAHNVFYYLTYEGAINIDQIQDPIERRSIEDQINNFGQTPMQLFKKPHPKKFLKSDHVKPNVYTSGKLETGYSLFVTSGSGLMAGSMPYVSCSSTVGGVFGGSGGSGGSGGGNGAGPGGVASKGMKTFLGQHEKEKMLTVDSNMVVGVHRWNSNVRGNNSDAPFVFEADTTSLGRRRLPCYLASNVAVSQHLFAHTKDAKYLFTCGHWDSSFQVIALDNGTNSAPKSIDAVYGHHDIVTCLSLSEDGRTLVTGSRDTTVIAWELKFANNSNEVSVKQDTRRVFYGHDEEVTCVAVNIDQDLVVSGSKDGTCIVHALGTAQYLRTIRPHASIGESTFRFSICKILITRQGLVVLSEESVRPLAIVEDFSVCNNSELMEPGNLGGNHDDGCIKDASKNFSKFQRGTRMSHLDVYSVNGACLKTRQFGGVVGDVVSSEDGMYLMLTTFARDDQGTSIMSQHTNGETGIVLEKLQTFSLKTVVKQRVENETVKIDNGNKATTVLSVANNQQCLIVGYSAEKVLVLTA
ncbi:hypothetical protein BDR26DRAFT_838162 [Obelidium mucronatum]|nr:hypothetical protein BDR26DRAFT_838162 [Obelidium mucronatum]